MRRTLKMVSCHAAACLRNKRNYQAWIRGCQYIWPRKMNCEEWRVAIVNYSVMTQITNSDSELRVIVTIDQSMMCTISSPAHIRFDEVLQNQKLSKSCLQARVRSLFLSSGDSSWIFWCNLHTNSTQHSSNSTDWLPVFTNSLLPALFRSPW